MKYIILLLFCTNAMAQITWNHELLRVGDVRYEVLDEYVPILETITSIFPFTERYAGNYERGNQLMKLERGSMIDYFSSDGCYYNFDSNENWLSHDSNTSNAVILDETSESVTWTLRTAQNLDGYVFWLTEVDGDLRYNYGDEGNYSIWPSSDQTLYFCDCSDVELVSIEVDDRNSIFNDRDYNVGEDIIVQVGRTYRFKPTLSINNGFVSEPRVDGVFASRYTPTSTGTSTLTYRIWGHSVRGEMGTIQCPEPIIVNFNIIIQ